MNSVPTVTAPPGEAPLAPRSHLYARLITLMQLADESAEIAYPRRLHMPDIHRQLIFMIGMYGRAASKDLATASGREKAQISRGVKALTEAGLIDRSRPRAISLNAAGRAMFLEIMTIARERDVLLREGLADEDIARFLAMTATLIDRASSIFVAEEQTSAIDAQARSSLHHPPEPAADLPRASGEEPSYRDLVMPWLQSLMTYLRRSGTTLFRREVGLSNFEWRVMSVIGGSQPINLSALIALISRDKSQVARMIKQLHAAGLIDRRDEGRVNAALLLTPAGQALYEKIFAVSVEREDFLFEPHAPEERAFYRGVLETLTRNAGRMLEAEKAARSEKPPVVRRARMSRPATDPVAGDADADQDTLREENARLKQLLAEAILENARLREGAGRKV